MHRFARVVAVPSIGQESPYLRDRLPAYTQKDHLTIHVSPIEQLVVRQQCGRDGELLSQTGADEKHADTIRSSSLKSCSETVGDVIEHGAGAAERVSRQIKTLRIT